jgi:hypothetical protein
MVHVIDCSRLEKYSIILSISLRAYKPERSRKETLKGGMTDSKNEKMEEGEQREEMKT